MLNRLLLQRGNNCRFSPYRQNDLLKAILHQNYKNQYRVSLGYSVLILKGLGFMFWKRIAVLLSSLGFWGGCKAVNPASKVSDTGQANDYCVVQQGTAVFSSPEDAANGDAAGTVGSSARVKIIAREGDLLRVGPVESADADRPLKVEGQTTSMYIAKQTCLTKVIASEDTFEGLKEGQDYHTPWWWYVKPIRCAIRYCLPHPGMGG